MEEKYYIARFGEGNYDYFRVMESELNEEEKKTNKASELTVFRRTFDGMVLCNNILKVINYDYEDLTYEEDDDNEDYQLFIVDSQFCEETMVKIVKKCGCHLYYSEALDNYILGVTDLGTSRDYVMTDIELEEEKT